jgi:hypothetical protein
MSFLETAGDPNSRDTAMTTTAPSTANSKSRSQAATMTKLTSFFLKQAGGGYDDYDLLRVTRRAILVSNSRLSGYDNNVFGQPFLDFKSADLFGYDDTC